MELKCPYCGSLNSPSRSKESPLETGYRCYNCDFELRHFERDHPRFLPVQEEINDFWKEVFSKRKFAIWVHRESDCVFVVQDLQTIKHSLDGSDFLEGDLSFSDAVAKKKEYEEKFGYR